MVLLGEQGARVLGEDMSDERALRLESYLASLLEATTFHAATEVLLLRSRARCICCIARLLSTLLFRGSRVRRGERPPARPSSRYAAHGFIWRSYSPSRQAVSTIGYCCCSWRRGSTALLCRCRGSLLLSRSLIEIRNPQTARACATLRPSHSQKVLGFRM